MRFASVFRWNGDMGELNMAEPLKRASCYARIETRFQNQCFFIAVI